MIEWLKSFGEQSSDAHLLLDNQKKEIIYANQKAVDLFSIPSIPISLDFGEFQLPKDWPDLNVSDLQAALQESPLSVGSVENNIVHLLIPNACNETFNAGIFNNNLAGIYRIRVNGEFISCNEAFAMMLGYEPNELNGSVGPDLYMKKGDRADFLNVILENGQIKGYESEFKHKSGSGVWCIENAYLEAGLEDVIIVTIHDITAQKLIQQRYRSLFDSSSDAILILNDEEIQDFNSKALELFRYNPDEMKCLPWQDQKKGLFALSSNEKESLKRKLALVYNNESQRGRFLCRRKDSSHFHGEIHMSLNQIGDQQIIQIQVRDISERIFYESSIRESEERFKMLSQIAMEGIVVVGKDKIVDCNDQLVRLFGYREQTELLGKSIKDFFSDEDLRRLKKTFGLSALNKMEISARNKSGKLLILDALGSELQYGGQLCSVFMLYDITSRKRAEQALEQSIDRFKNLVENSPNGIFILTDGFIKYVNQSGLNLLEFEEEDDLYDEEFVQFFKEGQRDRIEELVNNTREGEDTDYEEYEVINANKESIKVGFKATLTVYDNQPSIQVTINNLSTQALLIQEQMRAQIAEEINVVLKTEIEDHKKTQNKLRNARNFTQNIIDSSLDMIIAVNNKNQITEFNKAAQIQYGYSSDEILGTKMEGLYKHSSDYKKVRKELAKNGFFTGETVNVKKNGEEFTTLLSASLILDENRTAQGAMGVSRDVTELKKAGEELRASEERYRDIFENVKEFVLSIDDDGRFLYANNAFMGTMGYSEKDLVAMNFREVVKDGKQYFAKGVISSLQDGEHNFTLISKEGREIYVEGGFSVRYQKNKAHSVRAILRDITENKANEKLVREQTAKIISIFNSTENLMMWTLNKNGEVTSHNSNFTKVMKNSFGKKMENGTNYLKVLEKTVRKDFKTVQKQAFKKAFKGKPVQLELPMINSQNEEVWHQIFLNPVYLDEEMEEVSCLTYDITDRIEIDQKIRNSLKEKEVLLQEVHHRVKNNLQVISSILNLQTSFVNDEQTLEVLAESQNRIKTMSYIHESLYQADDFSCIEFTEYIDTLARNLLQSYAPKNCNIKMETELDEIYLDLDQAIPCGLIMNELVSNAFKYAFKGRNNGTLIIQVKMNGDQISLCVEDDGIGMDSDFRPEDSDSLGIYLVYALVEQLDAKIDFQSIHAVPDECQNSGTSFLITFTKQ